MWLEPSREEEDTPKLPHSVMWETTRRLMTAAAAKSLQSCPTLCDPMDGSPPGSPIPEVLQARTLQWVAISFSNAWNWKVKVKSLSHVWLFMTPWTAAHQAPPSMGFSRQEYRSGVPLPSLVDDYKLGKWILPMVHWYQWPAHADLRLYSLQKCEK